MSLTYREIAEVATDLNQRLGNGQIQKVYSSKRYPDREWVLQVRTTGETHYLLLSIDEDFGRLHLCEAKPDQPETPSPFTMLMRKWVAGSRIRELLLAEDDRVVTLHLEGGEGSSRLRLELTGRSANLVLESGDVLGAAHFEDRVKVSEAYSAPRPPESLDPTGGEQRFASDADLHQAIARWADEGIHRRDLKETQSRVRGALKTAAKRLRRLKKNIESDLARAEESQDYRKYGELLQSAYGKVDPGAESVTVTDYYDDDLKEIEIPLESDKSLQDNIDRYFHEYKRLNDAQDAIEERLLAAMEGLERVEEARSQLDDLSTVEELEALEERLLSERIIRPRQQHSRKRKKDQTPNEPYYSYRAKSGAQILVGRGAKYNDELSLKVARGRDIWLHARDWPGSHVILRMEKNQDAPQSEDLVDAATLAAHFSKGRKDTLVDVTYTEAKHINKPKGAAPGLVSVAGGSTIGISIEERRLDRLFQTRGS